jgi:hypothetical protein
VLDQTTTFHFLVPLRATKGPITVSGTNVGDLVSVVYTPATLPLNVWHPNTVFEQVVTVANQLQQLIPLLNPALAGLGIHVWFIRIG